MDPREMTTGEREAWDAGARAMRRMAAKLLYDARNFVPGDNSKFITLSVAAEDVSTLPLPEPGQ